MRPPSTSLAEEGGRRADPAEVAAAEHDPRDRDAAAAEEAFVHPADPTGLGPRPRPPGARSARFEPTPEIMKDAPDDLRRRRRPLRPDALQPLRPQRPCRCPRSRSGCGTTSAAISPLETGRAIVRRAFDLGVTHFDLANNYGPPYGSAEESFGRILREDLGPYRDELIISTKAGYDMWPGPVRRRRLAQVPPREPRPEPRRGSGSTTSTSSTRTGPTRHAARGDDGRARQRRAAGQGALRGDLVLLGREDARGGRDPARPRHAAPDPPALVLAAEPLDRAGPARRRSASSASAASPSRRSPRACSPTAT